MKGLYFFIIAINLAWYVSTLAAEEASESGRSFFQEVVIPELAKSGCPTCHAVGYLRPNVLRYEELLRRLAIGDSATNNVVIYKLANARAISPDRPNHPGGQRCATPDSEPCRSIQKWWTIEFGDGANP